MSLRVDRATVQSLLRNDALLVEVLPREEYDEEHLPGAISIPLRALTNDAVGGLDRYRAVIVYCQDAI